MGKASRRKRERQGLPPAPAATFADGGPFPGLTGLRGIAALLVFGLHAWLLLGQPGQPLPDAPGLSEALRWLMSMGNAGVDLFFVLSGFLLSLPFLAAQRDGRASPAIAGFLGRRVLRIFPAYLLQLGLFLTLAAAGFEVVSGGAAPEGAALVAHLFLWFHLVPLVLPWLPVWWTLPVEFGFYLLLPWLVRLARPSTWPWLLLAIPLAAGWRLWFVSEGAPEGADMMRMHHVPGRLDQFVIGMLAAYAWCRDVGGLRAWLSRHGVVLLLASAAAFLALPLFWLRLHAYPMPALTQADPWLLPWHSLAAMAAAGMVLAATTRASRASRLLGARPLHWLGEISYGVYLWHYPVLDAIRREAGAVEGAGAFWAWTLLGLAATVVLAAASYYLLERPVLARARRAPRVG